MHRILALMPTLFCFAAAAQDIPDAELLTYIDERIDSGEYVGIIIGFIDGEQEYIQSFGKTKRHGTRAPNENTLFEISSVSKTFVATLLGDLSITTNMNLSDPVNNYLPKEAQFAALEGQHISLRDLASHTAGLPGRPEDYTPGDGHNPFAKYTNEDLLNSIGLFSPSVTAGEEYRYSAFGFGVLALALSAHSELSFEDLVKTRITAKLGMSDTVMWPNDEQSARMAIGYLPDGGTAPHLDQGALGPAGSMFSTLHDLMIWTKTHMRRLPSSLSEGVHLTHVMADQQNVGLAWHQAEGFTDLSQYGTALGYRAYIGFLQDGSKGVVVLANTIADVMQMGERLLLGSELSH